jgi:hypothetical protein
MSPRQDQGWRIVGQSFPALNLILGRVRQHEGSDMSNPFNIDHNHSQAICQEIGARLQEHLKAEPDLPASFNKQIAEISKVEDQSPSKVPIAARRDNEPREKIAGWSGRFRRKI